MFGLGKKADIYSQNMEGVAPGSPEERRIYESVRAGRIAVGAAEREGQLKALESVGGEAGVVSPDDSLLIHSGEHPALNVEAEQPPTELPPQ